MTSNKTQIPAETYLTESLDFAAILYTLGFPLQDCVTSSDQRVLFLFGTKGKNVQKLYEDFHLKDIQVPGRALLKNWRILRRKIDEEIRGGAVWRSNHE